MKPLERAGVYEEREHLFHPKGLGAEIFFPVLPDAKKQTLYGYGRWKPEKASA